MIDDSMSILKFIIPKAHICFYICSQIKYYLKKKLFILLFYYIIFRICKLFSVIHFLYTYICGPGKNPSQNELSGENPSGEDPSKVSCGENPSPYFGACGENPSCYFQACGENPSTL